MENEIFLTIRNKPTLRNISFLVGGLVPTSLPASSLVEVKLSYSYNGEAKVPSKADSYCLEIADSDEIAPKTKEKLRKSCVLAADLKGYRIAEKGQDCRKLTADLTVAEAGGDYLKTATFQFFEKGSDERTLKAKASLHSDREEFNSYTMIAVCRAVFNKIPAQSTSFKVDASTAPDDVRGGTDDLLEQPPVNSSGLYIMSELMFNGIGGSVGYYLSEEVALEAGFLELGRSLNMDVHRLTKYYVKSRLFFTRKALVGSFFCQFDCIKLTIDERIENHEGLS